MEPELRQRLAAMKYLADKLPKEFKLTVNNEGVFLYRQQTGVYSDALYWEPYYSVVWRTK